MQRHYEDIKEKKKKINKKGGGGVGESNGRRISILFKMVRIMINIMMIEQTNLKLR